jgi:hypothetical protein
MARLLFPSSAESVTCMRCGNSILGDAETCPHCGADHGGPGAARKTAMIPNGLRLFAARRASLAAPSPYPSVPEEAEFAGTGEQRWDNSKSVTLGAVILALLAGGVIYSQSGEHDGTRTEPPAGHSVYGAIDMNAVRGASTPAIHAATVVTAKPVTAPTVAAPAVDTTARVPATPAAVIDNLQAARDAIERGDLTTARRRFSKIPAAQMSAANIQRTQSELVNLEHARDNLLQTARGCEATGSWVCVRQNARDVLAIDASNIEAQTLVEHAITRSGWLNKTPPVTAHVAPKSSGTTPLAKATAPARKAESTVSAQPRPVPVMPAPSTSTFIPMPDGPDAPVAHAASPAAPVAVRTPPAETSPIPNADQTTSVTDAAPVRAAVAIIPATPVTHNPAPATAARTLASGDNAPSTAQSKTTAHNTADPDAEERAILESGWTKAQSSKLPPPQ